MSDITKLINDSINSVIGEGVIDDAKSKGAKKLAQIDKMVNPKKAWEDLKDSRDVERAAMQKDSDFKHEHPIQYAGSKAVKAVKDKAEEVADLVKEHPYLSAATAAALAAGAGGLAAVKRMRKAAKK